MFASSTMNRDTVTTVAIRVAVSWVTIKNWNAAVSWLMSVFNGVLVLPGGL